MNQKIKIGVIGAGGRVGLELQKLIKNSTDLEATLGVGRHSSGFKENKIEIPERIEGSLEVIIDFSTPDLLLRSLSFCEKWKIPLVIGTTGLSQIHFDKLKETSQHVPILWSPNMSLGVALLKKSLGVFKSIPHFDFQIEEWHHRNKKDSPSGTAVMLKEELERVIEKPLPSTMVMRAGGIYGVHKIYAISDEEIIQFEHSAINRTVFARGAITAARWLVKQKSGYYNMDDVINSLTST